MSETILSQRELERENEQLRRRLIEAERNLRSIGQQKADETCRALIESMSEGVLRLYLDGTISFCNERFSEMVGQSRTDLSGRPFHELVDTRERNQLQEMLNAAGPGFARMEFQLQRSGAGPLPVQVCIRKLQMRDVEGFSAVVTDLSETKQSEQALHKRDARLRGLLQNSTAAVALLDRQGVILYESPSASRMFGFSPEEVVGQTTLDSVHPDDLPRVEQALAQLNAQPGARVSVEFRSRHKDGSWRWLEATGTNALQSPGLECLIVDFRDKTDSRFTEAALRASETRFRSLIENSRDQTIILTADGILLYESPNAEPVLGYPDGFMLGHEIWEIVHPDDLAAFKADYDLLVENADMHPRRQLRLRCSDGSWRWVEGVATNLLGEISVHGIVINYHDVTDQRLAQEKLIQSQRDLAEAQRVARIGSWSQDAETGTVVWSDELYEIFDLKPGTSDDLYKRFRTRIHPEDLPFVLQNIERARVTGQSYEHEYRIILGNGQIKAVASVGHALADAQGRITRLIGTTQDITERKEAEEKLRQNERELMEAQRVAHIGSWSRDAQKGNVHWSDEMYEIFHVNVDSPIDTYEAFLGRIHPEDRAMVEHNAAQALTTGDAFQHELRIITPTGEIRTIVEIGHALFDGSGNVTGLFGTAQDITERKHAETLLRQSEERYRVLYEDSPVSLWEEDFSQVKQLLDGLRQKEVTDFRGYFASHPEFVKACLEGVHVTDVNRATLQLFRARDKGELLSAMSRFVDTDAMPAFQEELANIAAGARQFRWEGHNHTLDGRQLDVNMRWSVVPGYEDSLSKVLVFIEDITERKRAEEHSRLQLKRLLTLREVDSAIASSFDERFTLNLLVTRLVSSLGVDAADVLLLNRHLNTLGYAAGYGFRTPVGIPEVPLTAAHAGEAVRERRIVAEPDLLQPERPFARHELIGREGFKSYFGVPLLAKGEVKGVLEIFHRSRLAPDPEWLEFLETFAGQAAIAIDNAQLFEGLQRSNFELGIAYDSTIEGWSRALDLRDKETEGHTQRVTEMTVELARRFGFNDEEVLHIRRGALLHDIGKMGVPDAILLKAGPLSDEDWVLMKKHPTFAYELLAPIHYLQSAALEVPYCHHERWDGMGYPRGLKGEQIPLAARIFSVVDVWDALTSDRPYRAAWSPEKALAYIHAQAGIQFDPQVVQSFLQMVQQGR